jgi:alpha-glucuronidase
MMMGLARLLFAFALLIGLAAPSSAEDGYDLWLRYRALPEASRDAGLSRISGAAAEENDPRIRAAASELDHALRGLSNGNGDTGTATGSQKILLGTPAGSEAIRALHLDLSAVGDEGYVVRTIVRPGAGPTTVVAGNTGTGVLYGTFALIRDMQLGHKLDQLNLRSTPKLKLRVLDHWDNLDGHIERGYAGNSLWDWWKLPDYKDPRYSDYARANASVGINGVVLNNVNAVATSLTTEYIAKTAALADVFRPWGIKVYLSARFTAPIELGGLKTADPLDPAVAAWWKAKADEIYRAIPDFGGFVVKANSEGQPGPQDYGRTHADGANVLAAAVAPHGGVVMYRAFVYAALGKGEVVDRTKQAYDNFKPLDGKFADNVLVQVKNGPLDFQPREPLSPLFGAMPRTNLMPEVQLTKEYLGQATHLAYVGALIEEVLHTDTFARGKGSTLARVIEGQKLTGIAGVANTGTDRDWSGSSFNQADWYAFGRLAWDPEASARDIAAEWAALTFNRDPAFVKPVVDMMMTSREAVVNYMTPLGLAHIMGTGHHHGPAPWVHELARAEWNPVYYHQADAIGIGVDRTATGTDAIAQYAAPIAKRLAKISTTPDTALLWFHHVPWDYRMKSGRILWDELALHYQTGVEQVRAMQAQWRALKPYVDAERFEKTDTFLSIQLGEAMWWRDACLAYFGTFSKRPLPAGVPAPAHPLAYYEALTFPYAPGR